jgi:hypothetical protein
MKHLNAFTVRYSCDDAWLDGKMYQITLCHQHQLVDKHYPVITVDNFNEINNYINQAEWLFIQMSGDFIVDRDHIWNKLHIIPENVGLIGHILWDPTASNPHLHHQCIIINTKALKGQHFDFYSKAGSGKQFVRSPESMHGNYCPTWVKLNDTVVERTPGFGTDVMSMILDNGYDVINFDSDWRENKNLDYIGQLPSRGFLNPDINTELFSRCFKTLTLDDRLDPAQADAIAVIKHELDYQWLNALHWDTFPKDGTADLVISPANGLMGECIANTNNANKIIFYDINANNIDFKRKLYTEWDGVDYESYYTQFANERGLNIDPQTPHAKETAMQHIDDVNAVLNNWDKFKNMDVEFIHADIIEITDQLLDKVVGNTILHTSTMLNYYIWSNIKHDRYLIDRTRDKIEKKMIATGSMWFETH